MYKDKNIQREFEMWNMIQNSTENDYVDFKSQWYTNDKRGNFDMIHDILSLANSLTDNLERYIFIGVNDDKSLTDVSEDANKRTSEDIIQKLRNYISVPPIIEVYSRIIEGNQIDCIKISVRNRDLPYVTYKEVEYETPKNKKRCIPKYAIFSRNGSRNNGVLEYASKEVVEELFARKRGEHLPVLERFVQYLEDVANWKRVKSGNQSTYYYTKNHTFKIVRVEDLEDQVVRASNFPNYAYLLDFAICEEYWKYHQREGSTYDDVFYWIKAELWADNTILEVFDLASIYLKYFFIDELRGYNRLYSDFYLPNRYDMLKLREDSMHPDALKLAISKSIQFKICRMMAHLDHEVSMSYCYDKYLDFINYKDLLDLNYRMSNKEFVYEQNIKLPKIKTN